MLLPSEAVKPVGVAGLGAVYVTTTVLPLVVNANVPDAVHVVPSAMFAIFTELPLIIVHEYEVA